jgi:lysozyme family protein
MSIDAFNQAFTETVGLEGKYSNDASDPGNWTGGKENVGELKGTMYGISAAAYPNEDIINVDIPRAKFLYNRDFWTPLKCDQFESQEFAIVLFKEAVNMGRVGAVKRLQEAFKISPIDGVIGNLTLGMINRLPPKEVISTFLTQCAWDYTQMALFPKDGKGWLSRIIQTALEANA